MAALGLTACSQDTAPESAATAAFERFQDALFAGDRPALAALLTHESRTTLDQVPMDAGTGKQRLQVIGVKAFPPEYEIAIRDPNDGGRTGTFVVVREDGRYVVDLVASAGHHRVEDPTAKRSWHIEPRALAPHERAQAEAIARRERR